MLNQEDLLLLKQKGISQAQINEQLSSFASGFPFLKIKKAASVGDGIEQINDAEFEFFLAEWENYLAQNREILKFVPASGAASRMFKDLFEFTDGSANLPETKAVEQFFAHIKYFAFYNDLNEVCLKNNGKSIEELIKSNDFKAVAKNLLNKEGLNYGNLPKGLLKFHAYPEGNRTPLEEHLVEGALYAKNGAGKVKVHFTVSPEHKALFEQKTNDTKGIYENKFGVKYEAGFSEQKSSTDTIAADADNQPFRDNGKLLFRPGGHGALIANLNDLSADVIFIKNIDNVVPDKLKTPTVTYKKLIAGVLVNVQKQIFEYLNTLEKGNVSAEKIDEMLDFIETNLCTENASPAEAPVAERSRSIEAEIAYIKTKLNRPIRVCGMVKNEGEPGGGPFLTENPDGTVSLQILESSQIDTSKPSEKILMQNSTHFNPVDLVCALKDYKGQAFDLLHFVDKNTGFISEKSKNGKALKALELPGLWNGAMSDWNTIFVEVPIETFNPVKTANDLLKPEHQ